MLIFKGRSEDVVNKIEAINKHTFRYGGKERTVEVGEKIDVRDFDVANKDVRGVEKHIMQKHAGLFELTDEKMDGVVSKEIQNEVKQLKSQLVDEQKNSAELKAAYENIQEKHAASVGEIESAKQETKSIRKDLVKIKKENDDLEDEVKKLRLTIAQGK